jgi:hypothetical protein
MCKVLLETNGLLEDRFFRICFKTQDFLLTRVKLYVWKRTLIEWKPHILWIFSDMVDIFVTTRM